MTHYQFQNIFINSIKFRKIEFYHLTFVVNIPDLKIYTMLMSAINRYEILEATADPTIPERGMRCKLRSMFEMVATQGEMTVMRGIPMEAKKFMNITLTERANMPGRSDRKAEPRGRTRCRT